MDEQSGYQDQAEQVGPSGRSYGWRVHQASGMRDDERN